MFVSWVRASGHPGCDILIDPEVQHKSGADNPVVEKLHNKPNNKILVLNG